MPSACRLDIFKQKGKCTLVCQYPSAADKGDHVAQLSQHPSLLAEHLLRARAALKEETPPLAACGSTSTRADYPSSKDSAYQPMWAPTGPTGPLHLPPTLASYLRARASPRFPDDQVCNLPLDGRHEQRDSLTGSCNKPGLWEQSGLARIKHVHFGICNCACVSTQRLSSPDQGSNLDSGLAVLAASVLP